MNTRQSASLLARTLAVLAAGAWALHTVTPASAPFSVDIYEFQAK
jgi:hypothetical protein